MAYLTKEELSAYKANGYNLDRIPVTERPKTEIGDLVVVEANVEACKA